ncbi:adhesin-like protein [Methanobrevibacter ruminantium M1]|uniref:Adhesin-like protein n=1 Tax=Methanobrevibacter ruminantium (strain ATCC 35063 / DSM 1093 / JCM 13430 / OCM 146 / M1) TaxID=634498 RepID=D3E0M3_METRM|nr:adhesin-like protein [Methanobrevibacter ruminantium]ADC46269.1 adhesin-like protein [Methanobrevibacter ruminantium M1]
MKFKKYLFILLIALICIISVSAVAASDANDPISQDNNQGLVLEETNQDLSITKTKEIVESSTNKEISLEDNKVISKENKKTSLKDEETDSFTNLNNLINIDNPNNHTISLNCDYVLLEEDCTYIDTEILSSSNLTTSHILRDEGSLPIDLNPKTYKARLMVENSNDQSIEVIKTTNIEGSSFWLLNQTINNNSNSEITLDSNYTFNSSADSGFINGIYINRSLKLNGNGITINGLDEGRIFIITADNVTITNVNFANGKSDKGGAILWLGKNGNISNCNFTDNMATSGGAIFWGNTNLTDYYSNGQGDDGTIINCNFIGNEAQKGGAMFFHTGGATIKDGCTFHNNTGGQEGGALFWLNYGGRIENNCNFTFNTAKGSGGAIYCPQVEILNNCIFQNNTAQSKIEERIMKGGGAIYLQKGGTVRDCTFIGNIALNDESDGLRFYKGGEPFTLKGMPPFPTAPS